MSKIKGTKKRPFIGSPGATFSDKDVQSKMGQYNTSAGGKGEKILFDYLHKDGGWVPDGIPVLCSIKVPGKNSDVDFALCNGNKILLIDAKMYRQDGGFFWSKGNDKKIYRNFGPLTSAKGNEINMSRSMVMAKNIFQKEFPNHQIESIVILVSNHKLSNYKYPNTWFLKFPGGVKAYNEKGGKRRIRKFFDNGKSTMNPQTLATVRELGKYVQ